jgi:hypothetical protein
MHLERKHHTPPFHFHINCGTRREYSTAKSLLQVRHIHSDCEHSATELASLRRLACVQSTLTKFDKPEMVPGLSRLDLIVKPLVTAKP